MSDASVTQIEADALLALEKHRVDETLHRFPFLNSHVTIPLVSQDRREEFQLDIRRGRIDLAKVTYQNRARSILILARLDLAGPPHRNPDGEDIPCPHLHVYREGYGDKWAYPAAPTEFTDLDDLWASLDDFMRYCNITKTPNILRTLT
jgi:hypothetical protein